MALGASKKDAQMLVKMLEHHLFNQAKDLRDNILACVPAFAKDPKIVDKPLRDGEQSILHSLEKWSQDWSEHHGSMTPLPTKTAALKAIEYRLRLRSLDHPRPRDLYWERHAGDGDLSREKQLLISLARTIEPCSTNWNLHLHQMRVQFPASSNSSGKEQIELVVTVHHEKYEERIGKERGKHSLCCAAPRRGRTMKGGAFDEDSNRIVVSLTRESPDQPIYKTDSPYFITIPRKLEMEAANLTIHFLEHGDVCLSLQHARKNGLITLTGKPESGPEVTVSVTPLYSRQMQEVEKVADTVDVTRRWKRKPAALNERSSYETSFPQLIQFQITEFELKGMATPAVHEEVQVNFAYFVAVQIEYMTPHGKQLTPPLETSPQAATMVAESNQSDGPKWFCSYSIDTQPLTVQIPQRAMQHATGSEPQLIVSLKCASHENGLKTCVNILGDRRITLRELRGLHSLELFSSCDDGPVGQVSINVRGKAADVETWTNQSTGLCEDWYPKKCSGFHMIYWNLLRKFLKVDIQRKRNTFSLSTDSYNILREYSFRYGIRYQFSASVLLYELAFLVASPEEVVSMQWLGTAADRCLECELSADECELCLMAAHQIIHIITMHFSNYHAVSKNDPGFWSQCVTVFIKACALCFAYKPTQSQLDSYGLNITDISVAQQHALTSSTNAAKQYLRTVMVSAVEKRYSRALRADPRTLTSWPPNARSGVKSTDEGELFLKIEELYVPNQAEIEIIVKFRNRESGKMETSSTGALKRCSDHFVLNADTNPQYPRQNRGGGKYLVPVSAEDFESVVIEVVKPTRGLLTSGKASIGTLQLFKGGYKKHTGSREYLQPDNPSNGWLKLHTAWTGHGQALHRAVAIHMMPSVLENVVECANDLCDTMTPFARTNPSGALGLFDTGDAGVPCKCYRGQPFVPFDFRLSNLQLVFALGSNGTREMRKVPFNTNVERVKDAISALQNRLKPAVVKDRDDCIEIAAEAGVAIMGTADYPYDEASIDTSPSLVPTQDVATAVKQWWTEGLECRDGALGLLHCAGKSVRGKGDTDATAGFYLGDEFELFDFSKQNYELLVSVDGESCSVKFDETVGQAGVIKNIDEVETIVREQLKSKFKQENVDVFVEKNKLRLTSKSKGRSSAVVVQDRKVNTSKATAQTCMHPLGIFNNGGQSTQGQPAEKSTHGYYECSHFLPCDFTAQVACITIMVDGKAQPVTFETNVEHVEQALEILRASLDGVASVTAGRSGHIKISSLSTGTGSQVDVLVPSSTLKVYGFDLNSSPLMHDPFFAGTARDIYRTLCARLRMNLHQWLSQHKGSEKHLSIADQLHLGAEFSDALHAYRALDAFIYGAGSFIGEMVSFADVPAQELAAKRMLRFSPTPRFAMFDDSVLNLDNLIKLFLPVMQKKLKFCFKWIRNFAQASLWYEWDQQGRSGKINPTAWNILTKQVQWATNPQHGWSLQSVLLAEHVGESYLHDRAFCNTLREELAVSSTSELVDTVKAFVYGIYDRCVVGRGVPRKADATLIGMLLDEIMGYSDEAVPSTTSDWQNIRAKQTLAMARQLFPSVHDDTVDVNSLMRQSWMPQSVGVDALREALGSHASYYELVDWLMRVPAVKISIHDLIFYSFNHTICTYVVEGNEFHEQQLEHEFMESETGQEETGGILLKAVEELEELRKAIVDSQTSSQFVQRENSSPRLDPADKLELEQLVRHECASDFSDTSIIACYCCCSARLRLSAEQQESWRGRDGFHDVSSGNPEARQTGLEYLGCLLVFADHIVLAPWQWLLGLPSRRWRQTDERAELVVVNLEDNHAAGDLTYLGIELSSDLVKLEYRTGAYETTEISLVGFDRCTIQSLHETLLPVLERFAEIRKAKIAKKVAAAKEREGTKAKLRTSMKGFVTGLVPMHSA